MTFRSSFRLTLLGGALCACVSQYTSPGGDVENTRTEPSEAAPDESSEASQESSEAPKPSKESSAEPSEGNRPPTEASGTCDDRSCVSSSDCCKGYQCGFDPERSKVTRYCLQQ